MPDKESHVLPKGKVIPLNSKQLLTAYVRELVEELGLPTQTTMKEIEEDLTTKGREPRNVQVIIQETAQVMGCVST